MKDEPILYIFGGLPASGKSSLAAHLARVVSAVYLRIDSIEEAILASGSFVGPEGYEAAYAIAGENLDLGMSVIADSVNSVEVTRTAWRDVAEKRGIKFKEIYVRCSDKEEHKDRLDRRSKESPSIRILDWEEVESREFEAWPSAVIFDTAGDKLEESKARFEQEIVGR